MSNKLNVTPETKNAQALGQVDAATGGVTPVIQPSTTFVRDENYDLIDAERGYGRADNPGFDVAENVIADLEGGAAALLFSSGMSAAMAIVQTLRPGDHIVAPKVMYWGLRKWMLHFCDRWGLQLDQFDSTHPESLAATVVHGKTKLVWVESPTNPTWDVIDIASSAEVAPRVDAL